MRYIKLFEDFQSSDNIKKLDDTIDDSENIYSYEDRTGECDGENCGVEQSEEEREQQDDEVSESYKISNDDYSYFERELEDSSETMGRDNLIQALKSDKDKWISKLLMVAKFHWELGDGKPSEFPKAELTQVLSKVIEKFIKQ